MRPLIHVYAARMNHKAGIGHYTSELVRCLRRLIGRWSVGCFPSASVRGWIRTTYEQQAKIYEKIEAERGLWAWVQRHVRGKALKAVRSSGLLVDDPWRSYIERGGFDLYHEPNYVPLECSLPTISSVHDLSALLYPQWHPACWAKHIEDQLVPGLQKCSHLIAISNFGKQQIVDYLGWSAEKVSVTYMGVRPNLRPVRGQALRKSLSRLGLRPGYFLHVGTVEPRKNLLMLLKTYCKLPTEVRDRHPLVLVGGKGWKSEAEHTYLENEARHRGVRWLGYIAEKELSALYSGAVSLLYPTFYEGFGMPTIEMMACGGAVLASNAGAVAETVGDRAHLIAPTDADGWYKAMYRICTDDGWRAELCQGSEDIAGRYSWARCAEETLAVYRRVVGESRKAA